MAFEVTVRRIGSILVVFLAALAFQRDVVAQNAGKNGGIEPPVSRTADEKKSTAGEPAPLKLAIVHKTPEELKFTCGAQNLGQCADSEHWLIEHSGKKFERDRWEKELLPKLTVEAAKSIAKSDGENSPSKRAVEINADRGAPWSVVSSLLDLAATAKLSRIAFSVKPNSSDSKKPSTLPLPLPTDRGATGEDAESQPTSTIEIDCRLSVDPKARATRFSCGQTDGLLDAAGEKSLEAAFREAVAPSGSGVAPSPILVVRPTSDILWQDVVKVLDAARSAGIATIRMASPKSGADKPRGNERIERKARLLRDEETRARLETTEKIVMAGLDWLKRHQEKDGSWDAGQTHARCDGTDARLCKDGSSIFVAGTTALAVLAFQGAAYDSRRPSPYRGAIASGVKWLIDQVDAEGCVGPRTNNRFTYSQAYSIMALTEALASDDDPRIKAALEKAVAFAIKCQNPGRGWRYGVKPGDNDASITSLMVQALTAARDAGVAVDRASIRNGLAFLQAMTDDETGRTGYVQKGSPVVRPMEGYDRWPPILSECLTAKALVARIMARDVNRVHKHIEAGFKLLAKTPPEWNEAKGSIDYDYWQSGLSAMRQWGGSDAAVWREKLFEIARDHQLKDGCARGSFPAVDPWSEDGGSIYTTAMMALTLESAYRDPIVLE